MGKRCYVEVFYINVCHDVLVKLRSHTQHNSVTVLHQKKLVWCKSLKYLCRYMYLFLIFCVLFKVNMDNM